MNFIPCITWIPKGVAKTVPAKVQLTETELEEIINKTRDQLNDLEENTDEEDELPVESEEFVKVKIENNEEETIEVQLDKVKTEAEEDESDKDEKPNIKKENSDDEDLSEYDFDNYDVEDEKADAVLGIANLAVYASNTSDPYVTLKEDKEDDDSEKDNYEIKPTDNLLAVGRVHDEASILEIYVFNEEEESFYVHHDLLLPAFPLCLEWLNFEPGDSAPGNLVAIGSMAPVIDVWDMDIVDCMEPVFQLGRKAKPKKGKKGYGHRDAVLDLSWNSNFPHVMASGSVDKTVILWDLETCSVASSIKVFKDKVQTLCWHSFEAQTLLTGSTDKSVRVFDCKSDNACIKWDFEGEIERVIWNHFDPFCYLASTDVGNVHYVDCRNSKPLWQLKAHSKEVTGLSLSPQCPGMLVTASSDRSVKIWDISSPENPGAPKFISEIEDFGIGAIHCATFCPDSPFVMSAGGDKKSGNIRVWHAAENSSVRKRFFNRELITPQKVSDNTSQESTQEVSTSEEAVTLSSMETEVAVSALESMSLDKSSLKKTIDKHKIKKKKKKPRFKQ